MSVTEEKIKVLFLCTGNSCRSQIAEGWARHLKSDIIEPYSAGISPGAINTIAITVMAEVGVDISAQTSKHVDSLRETNFDYVVTMCDNARQNCPAWPSKSRLVHRHFEDPSFMTGTEEQIMAAFRKVCGQIKDFVGKMPQNLKESAKKHREQQE